MPLYRVTQRRIEETSYDIEATDAEDAMNRAVGEGDEVLAEFIGDETLTAEEIG